MSMYLQPSTREELISALGQLTDKSRIIAGGTDLMPDLRKKRPDVDIFLSLSAMEEMKQIRISDDTICIGAMATHDSIARNAEIKTWVTALHHACSHVGSQQIRNRGTIGGSLANASPAGDMIPCVCLLGGTLLLLGADGAFRRIPAEDFTLGVSRTALHPGEVLFAIELPVRNPVSESRRLSGRSRCDAGSSRRDAGTHRPGSRGRCRKRQAGGVAPGSHPRNTDEPETPAEAENHGSGAAVQGTGRPVGRLRRL